MSIGAVLGQTANETKLPLVLDGNKTKPENPLIINCDNISGITFNTAGNNNASIVLDGLGFRFNISGSSLSPIYADDGHFNQVYVEDQSEAGITFQTGTRSAKIAFTAGNYMQCNVALNIIGNITATGIVAGNGLNATGNKITNVANPTVNSDAVNLGYMQNYVQQHSWGWELAQDWTSGNSIVLSQSNNYLFEIGSYLSDGPLAIPYDYYFHNRNYIMAYIRDSDGTIVGEQIGRVSSYFTPNVNPENELVYRVWSRPTAK